MGPPSERVIRKALPGEMQEPIEDERIHIPRVFAGVDPTVFRSKGAADPNHLRKGVATATDIAIAKCLDDLMEGDGHGIGCHLTAGRFAAAARAKSIDSKGGVSGQVSLADMGILLLRGIPFSMVGPGTMDQELDRGGQMIRRHA